MSSSGGNQSLEESTWARIIVPKEKSWVRLITLAVILGIWVAILIMLYFYTVKPLRDNQPATPTTGIATAPVLQG